MTTRHIDYAQLTPGIRETVRWLAERGFFPCDSGDGVTNPAAEMACAVNYPHVAMLVDAAQLVAEAGRLHSLLVSAGVVSPDVTAIWTDGDGEAMPPHVEASYDPVSELAILHLLGVDDTLLAERRA